uniref:Ig-like domain-containing protein n=1 Tax=Craspedostauros australis TaxID=1486917 RepID=A0A7R9WW61_9STRA
MNRMQCMMVLAATLMAQCHAVYLSIDSYQCSGNLELASLSIQCGRGDCDFGTSSIKLTGSVNVDEEMSEPLYVTIAAYIPNVLSSTFFADVAYPCDTLTTSEDFGYTCPDAGLYNFTLYYEPPEYGSTAWWSSGQITLSADFQDKQGGQSICDVTLTPTNSYTMSMKGDYTTMTMSVASLTALGMIAYFGRKRTCYTHRVEERPDLGPYCIESEDYTAESEFEMMEDSISGSGSSGSEQST